MVSFSLVFQVTAGKLSDALADFVVRVAHTVGRLESVSLRAIRPEFRRSQGPEVLQTPWPISVCYSMLRLANCWMRGLISVSDLAIPSFDWSPSCCVPFDPNFASGESDHIQMDWSYVVNPYAEFQDLFC